MALTPKRLVLTGIFTTEEAQRFTEDFSVFLCVTSVSLW